MSAKAASNSSTVQSSGKRRATQAVAKATAAQREAKAVEKKFNDKITRLKTELAQVM